MNWIRLLEIIATASRRVGNAKAGGWGWACYCRVCCDLRELAP